MEIRLGLFTMWKIEDFGRTPPYSSQAVYDPSRKVVFVKTPGDYATTPTTCEIYFYDISGHKIATYQCGYSDQGGSIGTFSAQLKNSNAYDIYFGGKHISVAGEAVVRDRLGSVRVGAGQLQRTTDELLPIWGGVR
jgi:hypothetical protein